MVENKKQSQITLSQVFSKYVSASKSYFVWAGIMFVTVIIPVLASGIIVPIYYKNFFDILGLKLEAAVLGPELVKTIFLILVMNLIAWSANRVYFFSTVKFQSAVMYKLRQDAYEYLIHHSYTFFTNTFSGSLVQKINRYMRAFERLTDRLFSDVLTIIVKIVGVCFVLWNVQRQFVWIILGWVIFYFCLSFIFSKWKLPYDIKNAELESKTTAKLADSLSNHQTIQIFDRMEHESAIFGEANREQNEAMLKRWSIGNKISSIQSFINVFVEFIVFFFAIKFWMAGSLSLGAFILIQIYLLGMMDQFWSLARIMRDVYESFGDAKEMVEILNTEHQIKDEIDAKKLEIQSGKITFENVTFAYNENREVLSGLNLEIKPGERIALIGPSGAGKSTLTKLLLRFYETSSGRILIDGQDISKVTQSSLRQAISFVPQDPVLFHRPLTDNIRYGKLHANSEEIENASKLAYIHDFIMTLPQAYGTLVGERGIKLSGGERQRVAIARAILKNSPILILDEATSSLDSQSEVMIQNALENLMKDKTVIVIAHRLSTIRKMNRIVVIDEGKILEQGTHDELVLRDGLYSKLWNLQSKGFLVYEQEGENNE